MKITFDLHTHTVYSHGKGTVQDNVNAALAQNIKLAISDHGPGHCFFGVSARAMRNLERDIFNINGKLGSTQCLNGVEANITGFGETDLKWLDKLPQVVLMGYHKGIFPGSAFTIRLAMKKMRDEKGAKEYLTDAIIACIEREQIDIVTHPGEYLPLNMQRFSEACARNGVVIEINNHHIPRIEDLKIQSMSGAFFILSSDAHRPEQVGRVDQAMVCAEKAGIASHRIINTKDYDWQNQLRIDRIRPLILD